MGKKAAPNRTTSASSDPAMDVIAGLEAKQRFLGTVLNLGWRLAIGFVLPVILGAWLDNRFHSSPSYTLAGIFVGVFVGVMTIRQVVKEVNEETAAEFAEEAKAKKTLNRKTRRKNA